MKGSGGMNEDRISKSGFPAAGKGAGAESTGRGAFLFKTLAAAFFCTTVFTNAALAGEWKQDGGGWWYQNEDSSYPKNAWVWIDGNNDGVYECYAFDANGYLYTNTVTPDNYAVDAGGAWMDHGITVSRAFLGEAGGSTPIGTYAASASISPVLDNGNSGSNSASAQKSNADPASVSASRAGSGENGSTATASRSVSAESSEGSGNTSSSGSSKKSSDANSANSSDSGEIQVQRTDGILHSGANTDSGDEEDSSGSSKKKSSSSNTAEQMDPTATNGTKTEADGPSGNMQSSNSFGTPTADKGGASSPGEAKGKVYWLNGSSTYHTKRDCSALHGNSNNIYSGTLAEAIRNEASEPCSVCG